MVLIKTVINHRRLGVRWMGVKIFTLDVLPDELSVVIMPWNDWSRANNMLLEWLKWLHSLVVVSDIQWKIMILHVHSTVTDSTLD